MSTDPSPRRQLDLRLLGLQLAVSAVVLGLLWWKADPASVLATLAAADLRWLAAACTAEVGVLLLRAFRVARSVGVAVPRGTLIATAAALFNLIVPARASDLAAAAWMARETGSGLSKAVGAFAAVTVADMLVHAVWLLVTLTLAVGVVDEVRRVQTISLLAFGILGVVIGVGVARRVFSRGPAKGQLGEGIRHTLKNLGVDQVALAAVQLALVVLVFRFNLAALGVEVARPWTAVAMCQALGALGSFLMPAAMGAGPATAASAILPMFGGTAAQGVAFGGLLWFTAAIPDVIVGLPALWWAGRARH